jgi:hypothetical protein
LLLALSGRSLIIIMDDPPPPAKRQKVTTTTVEDEKERTSILAKVRAADYDQKKNNAPVTTSIIDLLRSLPANIVADYIYPFAVKVIKNREALIKAVDVYLDEFYSDDDRDAMSWFDEDDEEDGESLSDEDKEDGESLSDEDEEDGESLSDEEAKEDGKDTSSDDEEAEEQDASSTLSDDQISSDLIHHNSSMEPCGSDEPQDGEETTVASDYCLPRPLKTCPLFHWRLGRIQSG